MSRKEPVVVLTERPDAGPLRRFMDAFQHLFGKVVSLSVVTLLADHAGVTVTNAAADPGTALSKTRTTVDFLDAGVDSVRVIVRGENSAAGSVVVHVYNTTQSASMASATVTNATEQTAESAWTVFTPAGGDEEIEVRVIGDGAFDPILYSVHLQMRTTQARV